MLTKFETKSNRVKGLTFHPTRPWVLSSLHNGVIQLWDYRIRTLLDKFDEHDGPVRGVCFHNTQPLFVSGGDDYKIKVWNYKHRRCLFTLLGHLDYIRTVEFHRECPWILSSSDDQTIRIWNWQSRTCIAVLTGHNHYVMCASFHPKEDLVVSASLDQTVRVWDISGLRKKTVSIKPFPEDGLRIQNDLFGNTDAVVKYVLEGHDRGVNWAAFHPTSPLIVSGADDRQVKLWRMSDTKAWEVDTFRGHFNNVSCALFHPRQELILSNSEDKTIRVWDMAKRAGIQTFRREHDRFWILCAHPDLNLFAAGHDSGMLIFKLERERPAYAPHNNESVIYIKDKYVRTYDFATSRDVPVLAVRRSGSNRTQSLVYSAQDRAILVSSDAEGGSYELYLIPKDGRGSDNVESKRGSGSSAVFVGRDRFAVLDKSSHVIVKNLKNEETKRCVPPHPVDMLFPGPTGCVLLRSEERITLYDVSQRKALSDIAVPFVKYVVWGTGSNSNVALLGRDTIILANRRLEQLCSVHETIRIKGGAWDDRGVFIYSTLNHIKYCLPNGDNGTIRTLDNPIYITAAKGNRVYCLDREGKNRVISIDPSEYLFKNALQERRFADVLKMVRESNLIGQSIISYLQKKGFPEVALHFVKDERMRFNLALECGNIEIALEAAQVLDDKECWHKLGVAALRQGNHQVVEMAYQRTKNFERLSFLYLITGNVEKLRKMLKIAEMRNDVMGRFHNALYLGDVDERIKLLNDAGQSPLATVSALVHGIAAPPAAKPEGEEEEAEEPFLPTHKTTLLFPPTPIMKLHESNWPLLTVSKGVLASGLEGENKLGIKDMGVGDGAVADSWGADIDIGDDNADDGGAANPDGWKDDGDDILGDDGGASGGGGGWDVDDLDGLDKIDVHQASSKSEGFWVPPQPGPNFSQIWTRNSNLAADHAAAGAFESAMQLLNTQVGAVNFGPLKPYFLSLLMGTRLSVPAYASAPSLILPVQRNAAELIGAKGRTAGLPQLSYTLPPLVDKLKVAYRSTTEGKFSEALIHFLAIIHNLLLVVVETKQESNEAKELLGLCREYITGLRIELSRKELGAAGSPARQAELAAYFTHCNLQPPHLILALRSAMTNSHKVKNYIHAASFAKRLLELNPSSAEFVSQARKVIKFAEQNPKNELNVDYDERNPFVVCSISFKPIYRGSAMVRCPYCSSAFLPEHAHKLCPTCQVSEIGREAPGLQVLPGQRER